MTESQNLLAEYVPVREFGWEGESFTDEPFRAGTLSKEIALQLRLVGQPQTFDLFDVEGARATIGVSDQRDINNSQNLLIIREDLLNRYLIKNRLVLMRTIWGEGEYATKLATAKWEPDGKFEDRQRVFRMIKRYKTARFARRGRKAAGC